MHILYIHQYFVPPDGSGGTRSYEMARRMVRAGHRVTLLTSTAFFPAHYRFDQPLTEMDIDGIRVLALKVPYANAMGFRQRVVAFLRFAVRASLQAMRSDRPDVVFATSTPLTIAIPAIVAKLRHRRPMVFEVRDLWPELPIAMGALRNPVAKLAARALERIAYRSSREIIALSPGMRDGVAKTGYPHERISVVPNSCDVELFRRNSSTIDLPFDDAGDHPLITYAGTLGAINGVDYLVDIAANALRVAPELRFLIAGDGAMRAFIHARAESKRVLHHNLWMIPPLPKRAIPALLARTTVAVSLVIDLPQLWHNSANKFFDALAAGRPVMINHRGWQADLLTESGAGLVVPPRDAERAAMLLCSFTRDQSRVKLASTAAARLAEARFDRDVLASEVLTVLTRAASTV